MLKVIAMRVFSYRSDPIITCQPNRDAHPVKYVEIKSEIIHTMQNTSRYLLTPPISNMVSLITTRRQAMILAGCAAHICCPPSPAHSSNDQIEYWDYSESYGPSHWGGLCSTGTSQSPIHIPHQHTRHNKHILRIHYQDTITQPTSLVVSNNGHGSPQISGFPSNYSFFYQEESKSPGQTFQLIQIHFHTPSEHTFGDDRKHYAMEAHLVHQNTSNGALAVLAVPLTVGSKENQVLKAALDAVHQVSDDRHYVPLTAAQRHFSLLRDLLPRSDLVSDSSKYALYRGSLTTPPCTENVMWIVFLDPGEVSAKQVVDFMYFVGERQRTLGQNARKLVSGGEERRNIKYGTMF